MMRVVGLMVVLGASAACGSGANPADMTFFVTSVTVAAGGNLGGLAGADAHCQRLAEAAGARGRTWRAYLSTAGEAGSLAVHARDRIGSGPWVNVRGAAIAATNADLHGDSNGLRRRTALTERGDPVPHDILTGSNADGTLAVGDLTCRNWTSTFGKAMLGHADKEGACCGGRERSWNSAHASDGCDLPSLRATGGAGLFYCFAQ